MTKSREIFIAHKVIAQICKRNDISIGEYLYDSYYKFLSKIKEPKDVDLFNRANNFFKGNGMKTPINELLEYIELLENESFEGWTKKEKKAYLTACTSFKKSIEGKFLEKEKQVIIDACNETEEISVSQANFIMLKNGHKDRFEKGPENIGEQYYNETFKT